MVNVGSGTAKRLARELTVPVRRRQAIRAVDKMAARSKGGQTTCPETFSGLLELARRDVLKAVECGWSVNMASWVSVYSGCSEYEPGEPKETVCEVCLAGAVIVGNPIPMYDAVGPTAMTIAEYLADSVSREAARQKKLFDIEETAGPNSIRSLSRTTGWTPHAFFALNYWRAGRRLEAIQEFYNWRSIKGLNPDVVRIELAEARMRRYRAFAGLCEGKELERLLKQLEYDSRKLAAVGY